MSIYDWSVTAATNATADSGINFAEGQAPSTVNDSCRQVMGRIAEWRDDFGGTVTIGGTANAITITTNSAFSAYEDGLRLTFRASAPNTGATTINANDIGAKSVRKITAAGGDIVLEGDEIQTGGLYEVIYSTALNSGSGGWQLMQSAAPIPIDTINYVPIGIGTDYWGATAPAGWIFSYGQAISRATYAALFAIFGETYGAGDGSTTFNVPDKRGRASFGRDDMGGTSADRLTGLTGGINGDVLGATGGAETHTLLTAQLPMHKHAAGTLVADAVGDHVHTTPKASSQTGGLGGAGSVPSGTNSTDPAGAHGHTISGNTADAGSGSAHNNVPPGIVCNYIVFAGV